MTITCAGLQHTAKLCLWCLSKQLLPASMLQPVLTDILGAVVPYLVTAPSSDSTRSHPPLSCASDRSQSCLQSRAAVKFLHWLACRKAGQSSVLTWCV